MILRMLTNYSYPFVLPYGQVQLRLDNTLLPSGVGLNGELSLGFPMIKISERTTNSHTLIYQNAQRSRS